MIDFKFLSPLALNLNFEDNIKMINKIKKFLTKLSAKKHSDDLQDESLYGSLDESLDESKNESTKEYDLLDKNLGDNVDKSPDLSDSEDFLELPEAFDEDDGLSQKSGFKDKLSAFFKKIIYSIPWFRDSKSHSKFKLSHLKNREQLFSLSPALSKNIDKILARSSREMIHKIFMVTLVGTASYTTGKITALYFSSAPELKSKKDFSDVIGSKDIFNPAILAQVKSSDPFKTKGVITTKKVVVEQKCLDAKQKSRLPIQLVNTIVLQDSVKSVASVEVANNSTQLSLREGDLIKSYAKISKIKRHEILIKNLENGICERIVSKNQDLTKSQISLMPRASAKKFIQARKIKGIDNDGNKFSISKKLLDEKIKDLSSILTQARAIKIQNPDGTIAFKMTELDPEGLFPTLGLQDQDIITSINGSPIYDMNEVMTLFARIKNLDKLQLGIKRSGMESTLDYKIKK